MAHKMKGSEFYGKGNQSKGDTYIKQGPPIMGIIKKVVGGAKNVVSKVKETAGKVQSFTDNLTGFKKNNEDE